MTDDKEILRLFNSVRKKDKVTLAKDFVSEIPWTRYCIHSLLDETRKQYFPAIEKPVTICFVKQETLANIIFTPREYQIRMHSLMNHKDTPSEVITVIIKHELLHIRIRPTEINEKMISHPPEFWEAEKLIAPERELIWSWVWVQFYGCLKINKEEEKTLVKKNWKKYMNRERITLARAFEIMTPMEKDKAEDMRYF
jgi:hypothetical protein